MYCSGCGDEIKYENAQFCTNCGKRFVVKDTTDQVQVENSQPIIQQVRVEDTQPIIQDEIKSMEPQAVASDIVLKSRKKTPIFFIIILLLMLLVIGMGTYILVFHGKDKEPVVTMEQDTESKSSKDELGTMDISSEVLVEPKENNESVARTEEADTMVVASDDSKPDEKDLSVDIPKATEALNLMIRQIDNTDFPKVTVYANVTDQEDESIDALKSNDFIIQEIGADGKVSTATIDDVYQVFTNDISSVNLILDRSGSMYDLSKMDQAINAAVAFLVQMDFNKGDKVGIISFDDYVYLEQSFTNNYDDLINAIYNVYPNGMTALYDAIYTGLAQTYYEDGAKCVIAFTDGLENASSYSFKEVVGMAQNTGIPVFIIGIGDECDEATLRLLANSCSGEYYYANPNNLTEILKDIYLDIYRAQKEYYVLSFTSPDTDNTSQFRDVELNMANDSGYSGSSIKEYVPTTTIYDEFSENYRHMDYILDFSDQRKVTKSDLTGLSLAELRIARNEIFARHGRQFKDSMLNKWFYSKNWYLNIPHKYSPKDFDSLSSSPLSSMEYDNAIYIREYEDDIMAKQDIFPDASNIPLSEYDLALTKSVLQKALKQVESYPYTEVLKDNIDMIKAAIKQEEIKY